MSNNSNLRAVVKRKILKVLQQPCLSGLGLNRAGSVCAIISRQLKVELNSSETRLIENILIANDNLNDKHSHLVGPRPEPRRMRTSSTR